MPKREGEFMLEENRVEKCVHVAERDRIYSEESFCELLDVNADFYTERFSSLSSLIKKLKCALVFFLPFLHMMMSYCPFLFGFCAERWRRTSVWSVDWR